MSPQVKPVRGNVIPAGVSASVNVIDGEDRGRVKKMRSRRLVVGRKSGDLILRDSKVSAAHAAIEYERGQFVLYDLNSTNGTFVNDVRITEKALKDFDEIKMGFTTLLFRLAKKEKPQHPRKIEKMLSEATETDVDFLDQEAIVVEDQHAPPNPTEGAFKPASVPAKQCVLLFEGMAGPHRGEIFRCEAESVVIGRVNTDVNLKDRDVSRKHAVIEVIAVDQIFIRDLASTNGTFINDKRVSSGRLRSGDQIRVGSSVLAVKVQLK